MIDIMHTGWPKFGAVEEDAHRVAMAIGGISGVNVKRGVTTFPLEPRLYELMLERVAQGGGSVTLSENAIAWYNKCIKDEFAASSIMQLDDVEINHPNAHKLWPFQRVGAHFAVTVGRSLLCDPGGSGLLATPHSFPQRQSGR